MFCCKSTNLVSEGAGHDEAGVTCCTPKVHEPPLSKNNNPRIGLGENPPISLWLDGDALNTWVGLQPVHVDLIIEVPNIANNSIILHLLHVVHHDDVLVARGGDEDIGRGDDILQSEHGDALHQGLEGAYGVNLSDDHTGPSLLQGSSTALANITIAADHSSLPGDHHVGRPHQAIRKRVAAPIEVVELFSDLQRREKMLWIYGRGLFI